MRITKINSMLVAACGLAVCYSSAASAWTWASSSNPIIMNGGGGYGAAVYSAYNKGTLQSTLKDTSLDGHRVYAKLIGSLIYVGKPYSTSVSSGQRADGESWYARMLDKNFYSAAPTGVGQYYYTVRLCKGAFLQDPCSEDVRGHQGL